MTDTDFQVLPENGRTSSASKRKVTISSVGCFVCRGVAAAAARGPAREDAAAEERALQ